MDSKQPKLPEHTRAYLAEQAARFAQHKIEQAHEHGAGMADIHEHVFANGFPDTDE